MANDVSGRRAEVRVHHIKYCTSKVNSKSSDNSHSNNKLVYIYIYTLYRIDIEIIIIYVYFKYFILKLI